MHNSKLISVLRCLSKRQLTRFREFVLSPYFNKNTEIISFYEYLFPFGPAFTYKKLKKEQVLANLAGNKTISEQTLAYWMNGLFQLLEQFLSIEKLKADELQIQQYLIQAYQQYQLPNHAQKILKKAKNQLKKQPLQNVDHLYKSCQLSKTAYEQTNKNIRAFNETLQIASDELDKYYLVEKLRYCCEMVNQENIINVNYDLQLGVEIINFLEGHPLLEIPAVSIYFNTLKMLKEEEGNRYFQKVKNLLIQYEDKFTEEELKHLYTDVLNYCTRRINRFNNQQYWTEYLEINKILLEKGLLFEKGKLSPWRYTNLVHVGLKTEEITWTKNFIDAYKDLLPEEYIDNMYAYNSGLFHYHQKNYSKAQELLFNMESKDILLNILNRSLLVKIYYETDQTELLLFSLEANRVFLIRNQLIDPKFKTQMKHFFEFARKLAKIEAFEASKLLPLREKIPDSLEIMHRDWLLEQIDKKIAAWL